MTPITMERFNAASESLGWAYRSLAQQVIHGFFAKHKDFYIEAALKDAAARGMPEEDYYKVLRDGSEDDLARYVAGRPGFGPAPLDPVEPVPTGPEFRQKYNTISLSSYNYCLLKVCRIVDTGPLTQVVSRIVRYHFEDSGYWEKNYLPQIAADKACRFRV
ncbi:hypothetical protein [Pseudanabaena sp. FACHB-2040]|uniref:hypothetical protein n=1 Tax=Pseudanabaena sp. FACHB-2040 TaxID=2692859 RepID=UPI001687D34B|nr:hypothetical protein [Pseudanabaena sp. FACHB-2040]MBD2261120.1 hypothetical protein [Pseudanabaena sp. FACHB-2040]